MTEEDVREQAHYTTCKIQPIDVIKNNFSAEALRGYYRGNVIKYIFRYPDKDGIKDLKKARAYIDWLIEMEEKELLKMQSKETPEELK